MRNFNLGLAGPLILSWERTRLIIVPESVFFSNLVSLRIIVIRIRVGVLLLLISNLFFMIFVFFVFMLLTGISLGRSSLKKWKTFPIQIYHAFCWAILMRSSIVTLTVRRPISILRTATPQTNWEISSPIFRWTMLGAPSIPPLNRSLGPGRMGQCRLALIWSVSPLYGHIFVSRLTLFLVLTLIIVPSLSMSTSLVLWRRVQVFGSWTSAFWKMKLIHWSSGTFGLVGSKRKLLTPVSLYGGIEGNSGYALSPSPTVPLKPGLDVWSEPPWRRWLLS